MESQINKTRKKNTKGSARKVSQTNYNHRVEADIDDTLIWGQNNESQSSKTLKYWTSVQWGQFYLMGRMPYGVYMFNTNQPHTQSFPIGLVKTESDFVRSAATGLGR